MGPEPSAKVDFKTGFGRFQGFLPLLRLMEQLCVIFFSPFLPDVSHLTMC